MRTDLRVGLMLVLVTLTPVALAEQFVVPLAGAEGEWEIHSVREFGIDLGFPLHRVDDATIEWSGELTAGWGWEGGPECAGRYVPVPVSFSSSIFEDASIAYAFGPPSFAYPDTEPFEAQSAYRLFLGRTWEPVLDGRFSLRVRCLLDYASFCTLTVLEPPYGSLDSAQLVLIGARAGDFDEDGAVDAADRGAFEDCLSGAGVPYAVGCEAGDFDRDDDVDCDDWDRFRDAWTDGDPPAATAVCEAAELSVMPGALHWTDVPSAFAYDVVRGDLAVLRETGGDFSAAVDACVANDAPPAPFPFNRQPPPGRGWWLLVRGVAPGGPRTWDTLRASQVAPRDAAIEASALTCP